MALIYGLQIKQEIVHRLKSGDESIPIDILLFESDDEKKDFLGNPEAFLRKVGVLGENDPFNGLEGLDGKTVEDFKNNPADHS